MHAYGTSLSYRCNGKSGSVPTRMEIKWFLKVRICCSAAFLLWFPGGTSYHCICCFFISSWRSLDALLSSLWSCGLKPLFVRCWMIFWWASTIDSLDLFGRGLTIFEFGSYAFMTIIYFFPLLDWIVNCPVLLECIFPVGIYSWSFYAYMLMYLFSCVFYVDCWVECAFFRVRYWRPSAVGIESGRNLVMLFSVKNGHVDILFFRMAFRSVFFVGLPMLRCKKLRVSIMVPSGSFALICGSTCC